MIHAKYNDLFGKTAIITGGQGFLGKALCEEYASQGVNLVILDKEAEDLDFTLKLRNKGVEIDFYQVDFESNESRKKVIENVSRYLQTLDILINNAAYVASAQDAGWAVSFENQSLESWNKALEVNLTTPFQLVQGFVGLLRLSSSPTIINVGSIYGSQGPNWGLYSGTEMGNPAGYAASKGGLIQLTRWLATTLSPEIRVNCVSPGGIYRNQHQDFVDRYIRNTPLNRMASEAEIVSSILFLSSSAAKYITGQDILVDGGRGVW